MSDFVTPWTAALQASLSIANSWSLLKLMSIESVMPFNCVILCHPLLLLPSIFSSIRVFSNESVLCIRWPKFWSFSFSISLCNENPRLISLRWDWFDLLAVQLDRVFLFVLSFSKFGVKVMLICEKDWEAFHSFSLYLQQFRDYVYCLLLVDFVELM